MVERERGSGCLSELRRRGSSFAFVVSLVTLRFNGQTWRLMN